MDIDKFYILLEKGGVKMGVHIDFNKISVGDILVIKDNSTVSTSKERIGLENYVPYFVCDIGSSAIYIENKGKQVMIFTSDFEYIEFIYNKNEMEIEEEVEDITLNIGDNVIITNINGIEGASELGFKEKVRYEITKIDTSHICIIDDKFELMIKQSESSYIKHESQYVDEEFNCLMENIHAINKQNEIDRYLDNGMYDELKELIK